MSYPGRPETKKLQDVLEEVEALTEFPDDDELEGRLRLCVAAHRQSFEKNSRGKKSAKGGNGKQAMFTRTQTMYHTLNGQANFASDMVSFFGLSETTDIRDGDIFMSLLDSRNVMEITLGKLRDGAFMFYTFFDENEINQIHDAIRRKRDQSEREQCETASCDQSGREQRFRMSKINALPKNYGTCAFCSMDYADVYRCPRCKQLFCSVKCYRSTGHANCSEDFYKAQIEQHLALSKESDEDSDDCEPMPSSSSDQPEESNNSDEQPKPSNKSSGNHLTFEQYMEKHRKEDARRTEQEMNPQIPIGADEELMIDPDDDPGYIQDVLAKTMKDFEHMNDADLDKRLADLNIDINDEEQLLKKLTPHELKAFKRVAEEMFEIPQQSCFK
ncbi:HIT-type domain-containing protein [Aphelenchoides bicaudatus]|nr:HIT-type domain-containing protein [Aphelenchoides bicaudatus]